MAARIRTIACLTILATALTAAVAIAQQVEMRPRVAVMPVTARVGGRAAADTVTAMIAETLRTRGADAYLDADLRPILRRHRIRSSMGVDREASIVLARETGATHLMLVTIETWNVDPLLEVGLTARVLRPGDSVIYEAAAVAATSEDHPGLFGSDRRHTPEELAADLIDEMIADLKLRTLPENALWQAPTLAIISLDAPGERTEHADAATSWLLAGLVDEGLNVLEPGELRSALFTIQRAPRGGVDLEAVRTVRDSLGVDYVLTGSLDAWEHATGDPAVAVPSLAWGLRLIDARTLSIVDTFELERGGRDDERLLAHGRIRALGGLARAAAADIASSIRNRTTPASPEVNE